LSAWDSAACPHPRSPPGSPRLQVSGGAVACASHGAVAQQKTTLGNALAFWAAKPAATVPGSRIRRDQSCEGGCRAALPVALRFRVGAHPRLSPANQPLEFPEVVVFHGSSRIAGVFLSGQARTRAAARGQDGCREGSKDVAARSTAVPLSRESSRAVSQCGFQLAEFPSV